MNKLSNAAKLQHFMHRIVARNWGGDGARGSVAEPMAWAYRGSNPSRTARKRVNAAAQFSFGAKPTMRI